MGVVYFVVCVLHISFQRRRTIQNTQHAQHLFNPSMWLGGGYRMYSGGYFFPQNRQSRQVYISNVKFWLFVLFPIFVNFTDCVVVDLSFFELTSQQQSKQTEIERLVSNRVITQTAGEQDMIIIDMIRYLCSDCLMISHPLFFCCALILHNAQSCTPFCLSTLSLLLLVLLLLLGVEFECVAHKDNPIPLSLPPPTIVYYCSVGW